MNATAGTAALRGGEGVVSAPVGFTWQMADHRSWACRLLRHRACQAVWVVRAVTYVTPYRSGQRPVRAFVACPCRCHGTEL